MVLVGAVVLLSATACSDYKFGIRESEHPQYFGPTGRYGNSPWKHGAERSWLTNLPIGTDVTEVEHRTLATKDDLERLGLPAGEFFFFSLDVRSPTFDAIEVAHSYRDRPLEPVGTWFYRANPVPDGPWLVEKQTEPAIHQTGPYG